MTKEFKFLALAALLTLSSFTFAGQQNQQSRLISEIQKERADIIELNKQLESAKLSQKVNTGAMTFIAITFSSLSLFTKFKSNSRAKAFSDAPAEVQQLVRETSSGFTKSSLAIGAGSAAMATLVFHLSKNEIESLQAQLRVLKNQLDLNLKAQELLQE